MQVGNFSSVFELVAAINIAFVVVEHTKNYTNILARHVFKLPNSIEDYFRGIDLVFEQRRSIEEVEKMDLNGCNMTPRVEACKRVAEKLKEKERRKKKELHDSIDTRCAVRNFSNQCLWSFLFSVLALFVAGIEDGKYGVEGVTLLFYVALFTIVYFVLGWIWGETDRKIISGLFSDLKIVIALFFVLLALMSLTAFLSPNLLFNISDYQNWSIPIFALIPFLNFIVYFIVSILKVKKIKKQAKKDSDEINRECEEWATEADSIIKVHSFSLSSSPLLEEEVR